MTEQEKVNLENYQSTLVVGASFFKQSLWYLINIFFFKNPLNISSYLKVLLLRSFGTKVGKGVVIKPSVNIKYPWKLSIGDFSWIGEGVWIDNLDQVIINNNVCISQGALLICGNHDYKKTGFDLIAQPIVLHDGVWIGTRSIVCGGVIAESHAVLTAGSVATGKLLSYSIYKGNPAIKIKERDIGN